MEEYKIEKIEEYRTTKKLSLFGFIIVNGFRSDFIWTNEWFKYVSVTEQKVKECYLEFDAEWSCQHYWTEWKESWKFVRLISKD